jgi:hypothetical protein
MSDPPPAVIKLQADPNSKEVTEFYRLLGMCVSSWAFVDRRLYEIFHHAIKLHYKHSAFLYYRNRAFNERLRVVDDALKMALTKEQFENEWRPLRDDIADLSHTRNIFAHHPTLRTGTSKDGKPLDIYTIRIEPYERVLNRDYPGLRGKNELGVEDLMQHESEVGQLEMRLYEFGLSRRPKKPGA